jgi:hypothetical protein
MNPRIASRTSFPAAAVLSIAACLALFGCDQAGPTESASPSNVALRSASSRAALIIRNNGCAVIDGSGSIVLAARDFSVLTQSVGSNTNLICKVKRVANPTGHAVRYDAEHNPFFPGLTCGTRRGSTTKWSETVSASGNVTLRCHFRSTVSDSLL